ncbi:MAG: DNA polymerase ligase N-terminal domain-containing protein [Methanomicrobiaceae archaeon]|nr:DNA polymerase ligase N-terminal domain-containing protein [Methanomicrobiaceae archaeon]
MNEGLEEYWKKRDFSKTAEPYGEKGGAGEKPRFVIQKHDASHLHYDFRLEVSGVLKSWAVPKGPSTDPRKKRLAIPTEDHPLAYIDFEGVIPEGEYGAGTVMVWDTGSYRNLREEKEGEQISIERSIDEGKVEVWLEGKKLIGGYALIRTGKSGEKRWLFFKMDDEEADARRNPTSTEPDSALSGRSMDEIREEEFPEK